MCVVICYDLLVFYVCLCMEIYMHVNVDMHMCHECACDLCILIPSAMCISMLVGGVSEGERGSEG